MKRAIIILAVLMMAGVVSAHDPNNMDPGVDVRWSVSDKNIATFDIRLPPKLAMVLSKLSNAEVVNSVKDMLRVWKKLYLQKWYNKNKPDIN